LPLRCGERYSLGDDFEKRRDFSLKNFCSYASIPFVYYFHPLASQYCPGGRGKLLDGRIHEEGESWSAVIDDANDW
jgi:hypothetical protein